MATAKVKIDKTGRLMIPSRMRRQFGLAPGSEVIVAAQNGELRVYTRGQALRRMQAFARSLVRPGVSVVEELIAERHKQARRELRD